MRWKETNRDPESFARALSAFGGERVPLDVLSGKALRFMLEKPEGCDGILTAARFEIRYGWAPLDHPYLQAAAPAAISYLLQLAGARAGAKEVQAVIGPGVGPPVRADGWKFGRRRLWLRATPAEVTFSIRDADGEDDSLDAQPRPLPEPIDFVRRSMEFPAPVACPYCETPASSFRDLGAGALVCGSCGRSFDVAEIGRP
jgi:hypothetical protein